MKINWHEYLKEIKGSQYFKIIQPIFKGSTSDKKFYIETVQGHRLLLKIVPSNQKSFKFNEFQSLRYLDKIKIPVNVPITHGEFDEGNSTYFIYRWLDGTSCHEYLKNISEKRQFLIGEKAGKVLKKIHTLAFDIDIERWCTKNFEDTENLILEYMQLKEKNTYLIDQIENLKHYNKKLFPKKIVLCHGDYHEGNLIVTLNGEIGVIDMDKTRAFDNYFDFQTLNTLSLSNAPFANGQIMGYFNNKPPKSFFEALKFGTLRIIIAQQIQKQSSDALASDIQIADKTLPLYLEMYENFDLDIPKWYCNAIYDECHSTSIDDEYTIIDVIL